MPTRIPPSRLPEEDFAELRAMGEPLSAQLARYRVIFQERYPAAALAYDNLVQHLIDVDVAKASPAPGDRLPEFALPSDHGRLLSSHEFLDRGPLVISFNRGSWCTFCWLELSALEDHYGAIKAAGAELISITPEVETFSRRLKQKLRLTYPILTDLDNSYALELGLAIALTEEVRAAYKAAGIELGVFQRGPGSFLPMPATMLVDTSGIIRHVYFNPDFRERLEPAHLADMIAKL